MSYLTELHSTDTVITTNTEVIIENEVTEVLVDKENGYVAEAIPTNFTISSGGIYSGSLGGNVPQWLSDLVDENVITRISTDYQDLIDTYDARITAIDVGVTDEIIRAQNAEESLSGLVTDTKAELNGRISATEQIALSRVTPEEATALISTLVGAKWLSENETLAESYINNLAVAKVSDGFATNTVYQDLISKVNDPNTGLEVIADAQELFFTEAGIDPETGLATASSGYLAQYTAKVDNLEVAVQEEIGATAGYFKEWDGVETPLIGMVKFVDGKQFQYYGAIIGWKQTDSYTESAVSNLSALVNSEISNLQNQIDGSISTWFADETPTLLNYPVTEWEEVDSDGNVYNDYQAHLGDVYYNRTDGQAYRFTQGDDPSDDPDTSIVYYWALITDNTVAAALAKAAEAKETADGKMTVWYDATGTVWSFTDGLGNTAMIGDIVVSGPNNVMYKAIQDNPTLSTHWEIIRDTTNDSALAESVSKLSDLEEARDGSIEAFYQNTAPTTGMSYGDYWVDIDSGDPLVVYRYEGTNGSSTLPLSWNVNTGEAAKSFAAAYKAQDTADGKIKVHYTTLANRPTLTLEDVGDMWVDIDTKVTQVWDGISWKDTTNSTADTAYGWAGGASSFAAEKDANGNIIGPITGWNYAAGETNGVPYSEFVIAADHFYLENSHATARPFDVDATNPNDVQITFNGKVVFQSSGGGTTVLNEDSISSIARSTVEQIQVGDKNINITDNLIPTTSLIADGNNAGYQFIGDPIKTTTVNIDSYSEPKIVLDSNDEVYSPYVNEPIYSFYYRFAIKGTTNLSEVQIVSLNVGYDVDGVTPIATGVIGSPQGLVRENNVVLDSAQWYIVEGIINPNSVSNSDYTGSVRLPDGTKVDGIQNISMLGTSNADTNLNDWLCLGWVGECDIARMKLSKITADTITGSYATTDYVNTTTIDGSRVSTGTILQNGYDANDNTKNSKWDLDTGEFVTHSANGSFVLDSTAAGYYGINDVRNAPNIEGAYIKGATIDATSDITTPTVFAEKVRIISDGYPFNFGKIFFKEWSNVTSSTLVESGIWYSASYGTGLIDKRICSAANSIVLITVIAGNIGASTCTLQRRYNGGNWASLVTVPASGAARPFIHKDISLSDTAGTIQYRCYGNNSSTYVYGMTVEISNI